MRWTLQQSNEAQEEEWARARIERSDDNAHVRAYESNLWMVPEYTTKGWVRWMQDGFRDAFARVVEADARELWLVERLPNFGKRSKPIEPGRKAKIERAVVMATGWLSALGEARSVFGTPEEWTFNEKLGYLEDENGSYWRATRLGFRTARLS